MADAKKEDKKSGSGFGFEEVALLILGLITIFFVTIPRLSSIANPTNTATSSQSTQQPLSYTQVKGLYDKIFNEQKIDENTIAPSLLDQTRFRVIDTIKNIFYALIIIAIFFTILLLLLRSYFSFKLKVISEAYNEKLGGVTIQTAEDAPDTQVVSQNYIPDTNGIQNPKWDMIQAYAQSGNLAELRLAIIEADIMLFDVLCQSGFRGENIGEVLKNINKSQLATLDHAWRAHKVRNELAHQGSNYILGRSDAEQALDDYKKVFDELGLI